MKEDTVKATITVDVPADMNEANFSVQATYSEGHPLHNQRSWGMTCVPTVTFDDKVQFAGGGDPVYADRKCITSDGAGNLWVLDPEFGTAKPVKYEV
jgi:hypothetical protein